MFDLNQFYFYIKLYSICSVCLVDLWPMLRNLTTTLEGGGGEPDYLVKLELKVAYDQQTKVHYQTFEGILCCPSHFGNKNSKLPKTTETKFSDALLALQ